MQPNPNERPFDKRTLLAFVLMGVVWIGWFAIFPPAKTPPPGQDPIAAADSSAVDAARAPRPAADGLRDSAATSADTPLDGAAQANPNGAASEWVDLADTDRGEPIVVRTPRFEAVIDRVGGDIVSWRLLAYGDAAGRPVELVGPRTVDRGTQYAHGLRVLLEDRALDLRRVRFRADHEVIALAGDDEPVDLVLVAERTDGGRVELIYTFDPEHYGFDVVARVEPGARQRLPMGLEVSWPGGIAATEPDSVTEYQEVRAVARVGEEIHKIKHADLVKGDGAKARRSYEGTVSWAGVQGKYFLSAIIEEQPQRGEVRLGGEGRLGVQVFEAEVAMLGRAPAEARYSVFMGPVDHDILSVYDRDPYNAKLTALVDLGPSIFRPVATVTLKALRLLYEVVPNWGWTIVIFSVFTKLLFWPLTKSSTESMKKMQEMQPKMKKLQQKYKEDPQRQSQEMMKLYKEHGVNPLNMGGCLPLLLQMPVFWALFTIFRKTIDLRQAEWMLWIDDLSRPDVLFVMPFTVPFFGSNFSLLPFLMAISMWAQTKLQQPTNGAQADNPMAQQMKLMSTLMPVMMFVFFYNSPSGLVLYWLVNTVLTAFQTWRVHSKMTPVAAPAA